MFRGRIKVISLERELMGLVARMKLQYFGHVTRGSAGNLALTVLEGSVDAWFTSPRKTPRDSGWTT